MIRYLAKYSRVPVPQVYSWNSDASNPAGVEYIIMQKVSGVPADSVLESLTHDSVRRLVAEVAAYSHEIFSLRFNQAGSLYQYSTSTEFFVGPIVSSPFYRALDGFVRIKEASPSYDLSPFRGPFSTVSDYLSSWLRAELYTSSQEFLAVLSELDGDRNRLQRGQRVLEKAIELCRIYPGDIQIHEGITTTPSQHFSLKLDDFRLSNIMMNKQSGKITALIDFEGTTVAPLWHCAVVPRWILPSKYEESSGIGLSQDSREALNAHFLNVVSHLDRSEEWCLAYTNGRPFRLLVDRLPFQIGVWATESCERWVDIRLSWAKMHPGVGFPGDSIVVNSGPEAIASGLVSIADESVSSILD